MQLADRTATTCIRSSCPTTGTQPARRPRECVRYLDAARGLLSAPWTLKQLGDCALTNGRQLCPNVGLVPKFGGDRSFRVISSPAAAIRPSQDDRRLWSQRQQWPSCPRRLSGRLQSRVVDPIAAMPISDRLVVAVRRARSWSPPAPRPAKQASRAAPEAKHPLSASLPLKHKVLAEPLVFLPPSRSLRLPGL